MSIQTGIVKKLDTYVRVYSSGLPAPAALSTQPSHWEVAIYEYLVLNVERGARK
jgi:hypothetical protein